MVSRERELIRHLGYLQVTGWPLCHLLDGIDGQQSSLQNRPVLIGVILGGTGVRTPVFEVEGRTPHFISTPYQKFCLVPHFSHQSYTPLPIFTHSFINGDTRGFGVWGVDSRGVGFFDLLGQNCAFLLWCMLCTVFTAPHTCNV